VPVTCGLISAPTGGRSAETSSREGVSPSPSSACLMMKEIMKNLFELQTLEFDETIRPHAEKRVEELRGALHNHSNWSDGRNTLEDTAAFMSELGLAYWAITDHSKALAMAGHSDADRVGNSLGMIWPVDGVLSSGFGDRGGRLHSGIDLMAIVELGRAATMTQNAREREVLERRVAELRAGL